MASWIIHLRVTQQLYRQLNIESVNEFVLGNIAPDSGIPSKDGSGFIPDAAVSHFRSLDENGIKNIHEEQFIRQYFTMLFHTNRELFWQTIKKDWYDLDFMYLKSNPTFEAFYIYCEVKDIRNTYVDFFPENAFAERRLFIMKFYADGVANIEEHSTYLSKEELDVFVTSTVNEIIAQLPVCGVVDFKENGL